MLIDLLIIEADSDADTDWTLRTSMSIQTLRLIDSLTSMSIQTLILD